MERNKIRIIFRETRANKFLKVFIWLIKKLNMGFKKIAYFCYSLKLYIDLVDYREEFNFLPYGRWFYRGRPIRVKK